MLYISDLSSHDLDTILDYIYLGEAQIFQEGIDKFLMNAQKLKLEGLLQSDETVDGGEKILENESNDLRIDQIVSGPSTENNKSELAHNMKHQPYAGQTVSKLSFNGNMDRQELEQMIQELIETVGEKCICKHCGKTTTGRNRKQDLANHIETHIDGLSFSCQHCGNTYRSRNHLKSHISKYCNNKISGHGLA